MHLFGCKLSVVYALSSESTIQTTKIISVQNGIITKSVTMSLKQSVTRSRKLLLHLNVRGLEKFYYIVDAFRPEIRKAYI